MAPILLEETRIRLEKLDSSTMQQIAHLIDLQSEPKGEQPEISQDAPRVRGKPPEAGDPSKSDISSQDAGAGHNAPDRRKAHRSHSGGLPVDTALQQGSSHVG